MSTIQVLVRGILMVACLAVPAVLAYLIAQKDMGMALVALLFGEVAAITVALLVAVMGRPEMSGGGDKPAQ